MLERQIGSGGMGTVWAARDERNRRSLALKVLHAERDFDSEARIRLRREALATRTITHPAIVAVSEVLEHENRPVLVMELLDGETLRAVLQREGQLPLARVSQLLVPVSEALAEAHAAGIVHRDLKPENVFIQRRASEEQVRLLDFGVARFYEPPANEEYYSSTGQGLTGIGALVGTAAYMAPEQALRPSEVDHRVDVWSLGVTLYEALSGCRPIEGTSTRDTLRQLLVGCITPLEVLRPELPAPVIELVGAMLARNPERRPSDVREVARVLAELAGSGQARQHHDQAGDQR